ncbi:hypothetical protein KP509_25G050200 [Ceratopteris richardii]|uniref:Transmembrane protein n=1 Tax=Ceratopteris richardii TaxID=49495 RepID=A0A8T2RQ06_CERRI|nr:hypothetical protein KP509_25G050200 [Ceratopteris richardii]
MHEEVCVCWSLFCDPHFHRHRHQIHEMLPSFRLRKSAMVALLLLTIISLTMNRSTAITPSSFRRARSSLYHSSASLDLFPKEQTSWNEQRNPEALLEAGEVAVAAEEERLERLEAALTDEWIDHDAIPSDWLEQLSKEDPLAED